MDLACCLHTDLNLSIKKRNPIDKGWSKSLLEKTWVLCIIIIIIVLQHLSWGCLLCLGPTRLVQRILYSIAKPTPNSGGGTPAYLDLLAGHWVVICGNREMKISFKACCMHPSSIHTRHTHTSLCTAKFYACFAAPCRCSLWKWVHTTIVKFDEGKQLGRSDLLELMASLKYDFAVDRRRPSCTLVDRYAHCWVGFELCAASRTSDEF